VITGESATAGAEAGGSQAISEHPNVPTIMGPADVPRLGDGGSRPTLTPITVAAPQRESDRRPIYVGFGLVVLAAVFWWNRRRREKFEREDLGVLAAPPGDRYQGSDSDDLHAAAAAADGTGDADADGSTKEDKKS
jgi:hypothetical protein